ncbi:MAG: hypothetical protein SFZ02_06595 [bacterium]|nr:hypothetical protein [bacterium]
MLALLLMIVGCTPEAPATPIPTLSISPIPATNTPFPATETPTPEPRLSPADLVSATAQDPSVQISRFIQADVQTRIAEGEIIEDVTILPMRWENSPTLGCEPSESSNVRRIEGFLVLVTAGEQVYEYHTDQAQLLVLCVIYPTRDMPVDIRLLIDPLAVELVALAQRRLATEFDILERRVRPIEIIPYSWVDSSLGCPDPRQTYTPQVIDGYRMVMQVGEALYAFHTDNEQIRPCPDGQEVLPIEAEITPNIP